MKPKLRWLVILGLWGSAHLFAQALRQAAVDPTLVLYNARVLTMDNALSVAQAVAVRGERIQAVGSSEEILKLAGPGTRKVDLGGKALLPGFGDSHFHLVSSALERQELQLTSARNIDELVQMIAQAAKTTPRGKWIVPSGNWTLGQLKENRLPTARELDRATTEHPVWVQRGDHRGVANSLALKLAGITRDTKTSPGGEIGHHENGEPNGLLVDKAQPQLKRLIPSPTVKEKTEAVLEMQSDLHAAGITSIYDAAAFPDDIKLLQEIRDAGQLTMRVSLRMRAFDMDGYRTIQAMPRTGFGDSWLRIGSIKMGVDGGSDGNLFSKPYVNRPDYYGIQTTPTETLRQVVLEGNRDGWSFSFHCNGDQAIDILLSLLDEANAEKSLVGRRWTIEHGRYPRPDQMARIKKLGLWISIQANPYWLSSVHIEGFGLERASYGNPLRELIAAGIPLAGGSDHSIYFHPLLHAWWYVTRQTRDSGVLGLSHAITPQEALLLETRYPPYLTFEESRKGTVEPDKFADFVVLAADPLQVPPSAIRDVKVVATMVGGKIVYGSW